MVSYRNEEKLSPAQELELTGRERTYGTLPSRLKGGYIDNRIEVADKEVGEVHKFFIE